MSDASIAWLTAFIDLPADRHQAGTDFWARVAGTTVSEARGPDGEFATLIPASGDAYLRVQNTGRGHTGVHLDLHTTDRPGIVDLITTLGGREHTDHGDLQIMTSPGGMRFCVVDHDGNPTVPPPLTTDGDSSRVDRVMIEVSPEVATVERDFWAELTRADAPQPLAVTVQELPHPVPITRAHLDVATSNVAAEVERHVRWGATVTATASEVTVMSAPGGIAYRIVAHAPG